MSNKRSVFSEEEKSYVISNYKTVNNTIMSECLAVCRMTVIRLMKSLNLTRTPAEKQNLITDVMSQVDRAAAAKKRWSIEPGPKSKLHRDRWVSNKGKMSKGKMLVYNNANYGDFNDLVVIQNKNFDKFVYNRDKRLGHEVKEGIKTNERQKKFDIKTQLLKKKHERVLEFEKNQRFLENYYNKTIKESNKEQASRNKVPVKVDHKTVVWMDRDKCIKNENGMWIKKQ